MTPQSKSRNLPIPSPIQEGKPTPSPSLEGNWGGRAIASSSPTLMPYIAFELPQGFAKAGQVYRQGQMRLATGEDEWVAQQTVQTSVQPTDQKAHSILIRLSRVTSFTGYPSLCPDDIGHLFMPDLNYLLEFYNALNPPECRLSLSGEFQAIPGGS